MSLLPSWHDGPARHAITRWAIEEADANGWTVVSMKDDWTTVFGS